MPERNVVGLMLRPNTMFQVFSGDDGLIITSTIIELATLDNHFTRIRDNTIIRATRLEDGNTAVQQELLRDLRWQRSRLKKSESPVPHQLATLISILEDKAIRGATGEEVSRARVAALCA